ncbi:MAG TPA: hypothetical protein VMU26_08050 [Candidatus Polarisedimenticolia bacterium]|nr:hypothetical protein [Candidatus Polarisedimenticolia bacterium]
MKGIGKYAWLLVTVLVVVGLMFLAVPKAAAQQDGPPIGGDADDTFNPPPCDYNDQFYGDNGIDVTQLVGRFGDNNGTTRLTGPPATGNQKNYVADSTCSVKDPNRRNFRILATTGGNSDDSNSPFTCTFNGGVNGGPNCVHQSSLEPETFEFISILAFVNNQNAFSNSYLRNVGFINGGLEGVQQNPGEDISIGQTSLGEAPAQTLRGFAMQDIVSNFEAYAALKQTTPQGFATGPCSLQMMQAFFGPTATVPSPCFPVADTVVNGQVVSDVATPNLRQDWRFATNRNAMDGSDNNDPVGALTGGVVNAPFGYFCDDLLGMWVITYFWFTQPANTQVEPCKDTYAAIGAKNGFNLDGTPIILTAFELNTELEAAGCGAEAKEDLAGGDGGAVWLICPGIPDPRAGAIATDAFSDQVRNSKGVPQNLALTANFLSLQIFGKFANELTSSQLSKVMSAATSAN